MKRIIAVVFLIILILGLTACTGGSDSPAQSQQDESLFGGAVISPFNDPGFEATVREIIGKPEGYITVSDVFGITYLNVRNRSINDISGIEYFTSLQVLLCGNNQLTTLDVTNNIALKRLECIDNQLTALDLTNNPALTNLECQYNRLSALDVTNNTALRYLDCTMNGMTQHDVIGWDDIGLVLGDTFLVDAKDRSDYRFV